MIRPRHAEECEAIICRHTAEERSCICGLDEVTNFYTNNQSFSDQDYLTCWWFKDDPVRPPVPIAPPG